LGLIEYNNAPIKPDPNNKDLITILISPSVDVKNLSFEIPTEIILMIQTNKKDTTEKINNTCSNDS
jgi:hypothetical protein